MAHKIVQRVSEGAPFVHHCGHTKTLLEEDREFMLGLVHEEPSTTLATLQMAFHDVYGRWYSLPTICWCFDEFAFSFKQVTLGDKHAETPENLARRVAYARDFAMMVCVNQTAVVYMDEVGFNLANSPSLIHDFRKKTPTSQDLVFPLFLQHLQFKKKNAN